MNKRKTRGGGARESGMRDRGLGGGAATSPSERRGESRQSGGARDSKDMGGPGARAETEGVYKNARLMHTFTSLIGAPLRVELQSGKIFEGILTTFSPDCEAVLEVVHEVEQSNPDLVDVETVQPKVVFSMKDVVQFCVMNTDLSYASKEDFQTDAQIAAAKQNGEAPMKQLEEWVPEEGDDGEGGIEDVGVGGVVGGGGGGNSNGWSVHEMFAKNAEFGVETSYDPKLRGYTTELKNADNDDWREKQRQAARIAAEIEGSERSQKQLALEIENGDEEELFSAVHRNDNRRSDGPRGADKENWREERRGGGGREDRGRGSRGGRGGSRTTPPGNRSTPPPRYGDHGEEQGFRGDRRGGYDREGRGGGRGGYDGRHGGEGGGRYNDARNYNDYRGDERRGGGGGGGRDFRDDRRSDGGRGGGPFRGQNQNQQQLQQQQEGGNKGAHQEKKSSPLPPSSGQDDQGRGNDRRKSQEGANNREGGGRQAEQRSPGDSENPGRSVQGRKDKTREQTNHDLKDFNQKFHLAAEDTLRTSTTPSVSVKATGGTGSQPLPSPSSQQPSSEPPSPAPAPSPQTQPSPQASTAASTPAPEVKKSTLNPNAKEFSLNPTAKEFTPRPARVAPTPPRPQTPNTPQGGPIPGQPYQGYMLAPGPGQPLAMSHVNHGSTPVFMQHPGLPGSGTTQFLPRGGGPPHQTRGGGGGPGGKDNNSQQSNLPRPDLPSPMAVTGHPILAAPGLNPGQPPHGQPYFSPHVPGQQVYGQPGQVIRMMVPAGMPGGAMMPGMVPVMTSHSGETPGVGHQHSTGSQGHHQQMWGGTPSPHPPHLTTATPPTQPQPPPSATPPQPSPGLYHQPQPTSLPPQGYPAHQPMFVIPGGGMVPTTMAGPGAGHPAHLIGQQSPQYYAGPGGQPVTSMGGYMINPQFQHIQHQGAPGHLPLHMQAQQPPPQQPPPQQQQQLNQ